MVSRNHDYRPTLNSEHQIILFLSSIDTKVGVELSESAWNAVREGRAVIDRMIAKKEIAYGINTGQGRGKEGGEKQKRKADRNEMMDDRVW